MAEARAVGPRSAMNGAWMNDASGSQWAFAGIGRTRVGRDLVADLGEDPDEVDVQAVARGEVPRDVDVVGGIGVRRVGEEDHQSDPDDERKQIQEDRDPHGRCSVAPPLRASDQYELATPAGPSVPCRGWPRD